ncbi:MAG: hypothetical protein KTR31_09085 [Myxococcales bacterium]|nr:hypothetical protein [Myxococcales bacterium]
MRTLVLASTLLALVACDDRPDTDDGPAIFDTSTQTTASTPDPPPPVDRNAPAYCGELEEDTNGDGVVDLRSQIAFNALDEVLTVDAAHAADGSLFRTERVRYEDGLRKTDLVSVDGNGVVTSTLTNHTHEEHDLIVFLDSDVDADGKTDIILWTETQTPQGTPLEQVYESSFSADHRLTFTYDDEGRPATRSADVALDGTIDGTWTYGYEPRLHLRWIDDDGNGYDDFRYETHFDHQDRVIYWRKTGPDGGAWSDQITFVYDETGLVEEFTDNHTGRLYGSTYVRDAQGRVIRRVDTGADGTPFATSTYTYGPCP